MATTGGNPPDWGEEGEANDLYLEISHSALVASANRAGWPPKGRRACAEVHSAIIHRIGFVAKRLRRQVECRACLLSRLLVTLLPKATGQFGRRLRQI